MKKTIAILLILVIGMVGVFAAVSPMDLHLKTTVTAIHEMRITADENTPSWLTDIFTDGVQTFEASDSVYGTAMTPKEISFNTTAAQIVGYLHVRTNSRTAVMVSITAEPLESVASGSTDVINYVVSNATGNVFDTSDDTTEKLFYTLAAGTGLHAGFQKISVALEDASEKPADDYTGNITFIYSVN